MTNNTTHQYTQINAIFIDNISSYNNVIHFSFFLDDMHKRKIYLNTDIGVAFVLQPTTTTNGGGKKA